MVHFRMLRWAREARLALIEYKRQELINDFLSIDTELAAKQNEINKKL